MSKQLPNACIAVKPGTHCHTSPPSQIAAIQIKQKVTRVYIWHLLLPHRTQHETLFLQPASGDPELGKKQTKQIPKQQQQTNQNSKEAGNNRKLKSKQHLNND